MQIGHQEEELGTPLFNRLTRGVELTEAGALLLEDPRRILEQVEQTKANAQRRARGDTGRIRVGLAGVTYFPPLVPALIRAYRNRYPDVVMVPEQSNTPHLVAAMRDALVDVAFVRPPIGDVDEIGIRPLFEELMRIVLPAHHLHARRRSVPLAAMAEETFILFPRAIGPGLHDAIIASCHHAGFSPRFGQEAPQISSMVHLVAARFGVSVVPQSSRSVWRVSSTFRSLARRRGRRWRSSSARTTAHRQSATSSRWRYSGIARETDELSLMG
jgi:DNA-binding transcriptional LysR family regulator